MRNALTRFWLIGAAALAALLLTLALGRWQLDRAAQKEAVQLELQQRSGLAPLDTAGFLALPDALAQVHRPVQLRGTWLPGHTVFLDNRQMQAKPGFYVLTPMQLAQSQAVVLVQRGWVARNFVDRSSVPAIHTPAVEVLVEGRIAPPPSKLYAFGGEERTAIRQNLDMAQFAAELGRPLLAASILQTGAGADGMLRDWPAPASGVEKHYGYAFQWFGLSALIVILYVWFQVVRRFK